MAAACVFGFGQHLVFYEFFEDAFGACGAVVAVVRCFPVARRLVVVFDVLVDGVEYVFLFVG